MSEDRYQTLADNIQTWANELGFQQVGITDADPGEHAQHLRNWLARGYHGEMHYMGDHGTMRMRPDELLPGTVRVISVRMDYLGDDPQVEETLDDPDRAYVARYALGRDYHKVIRARLRKLELKIGGQIGEDEPFVARAFTDSAPVLEKALAEKAGLGWIGKNTLLINRYAGSWFFLGEILTNLPLPVTAEKPTNHCGSCSACMDICPTDAIVAPYQLDARRCISYFTIESRDAIPENYRTAVGNRIFGCDDCQMVCPWNRYAQPTIETDFSPRHGLDTAGLLELFRWSEDEFLRRTEGSAIRRTGYRGWLRNLAVALGNATTDLRVVEALRAKLREVEDEMVIEHINWAISQQTAGQTLKNDSR